MKLRPAIAQAILIIMMMGFFMLVIESLSYLSDGRGAEAVLCLGGAMVMWILIPTIEEPDEA